MQFINEYFEVDQVSAPQMDWLWSNGWRHFGTYFFRYSRVSEPHRINTVLPLRVALSQFKLSRSQQRVLKKNADLRVVVREAFIDHAKEALFHRHKTRFERNVPNSIYDFFSPQPAHIPCQTKEFCLYLDQEFVGVSFLDLGLNATSSVYSIYEPQYASRSLGILLILLAIQYSLKNNKLYYYPGYAFQEPSVYDYKKRLSGLEYFDWRDQWLSFTSMQ